MPLRFYWAKGGFWASRGDIYCVIFIHFVIQYTTIAKVTIPNFAGTSELTLTPLVHAIKRILVCPKKYWIEFPLNIFSIAIF